MMSALVNHLLAGVPTSAAANATNHAVSGLISGFLAGSLGLLTHQRKHGQATQHATAEDSPTPATSPLPEA
ncbi:hypothetical protein ACIHFC_09985 [Streptomyces sp. NPDC052013]|uniref:hypothetical protein n=1 Tax=Streptomyces sp. NPDC052013 TaxID=3365679 RepID=UPI0037D548F1